MSQYFPKPFNSHFGDSIKIKIDLSNYATKIDTKNIWHVDTSRSALKTNLASLKTEVDELEKKKKKRTRKKNNRRKRNKRETRKRNGANEKLQIKELKDKN